MTYRGNASAIPDLISGQIDLMFVEQSITISHLAGGSIKAYAILSTNRSAAVPEIPTIEEAGGPPLHIVTWRGMWVPKGTPADVSMRLGSAVVEALSLDSRVVLIVQGSWRGGRDLADAFEAKGAQVVLPGDAGFNLAELPPLSAAVLDSNYREVCQRLKVRDVPAFTVQRAITKAKHWSFRSPRRWTISSRDDQYASNSGCQRRLGGRA